jgi:hypothetical protein
VSAAAVTLDMSKAQPIAAAPAVTLDMSKAQPINQPSQWDAAQEAGHQNRLSALAGLTRMPTPNMSEQDKASFEQGKMAGAVSVPAVAAGVSGMASPVASAALLSIAKRYGIKALEGAGVGLGYDLYKELKKTFEGGQ